MLREERDEETAMGQNQADGMSGVQRPVLYAVIAVIGVAVALPLAISSGQTEVGGLFDECYDTPCGAETLLASIKE